MDSSFCYYYVYPCMLWVVLGRAWDGGWMDGSLLRCTFDDVLDVGPVGYYVECVLWWTAGFHDERVG
jgi:hypothetical protein